ncbi:hypothetical protein FBU30_002718, partial [Linnemannia zychae]
PKSCSLSEQQGSRAEVDRAIRGMLNTVHSVSRSERRPLVVIGDGKFTARNGNAVKANKFITTLRSRAEGEGMLVASVDEFRTSIFYCRCHQRMVATKRSVTCQTPECGGKRSQEYNVLHNLDPAKGLERDRDHDAGQNMANAAIQ